MKKYIIILSTLLVGCTAEINDDKNPDMIEVGNIEVIFSIDGKETDVLELASVSHEIMVDVSVNNENINWVPVSDQEWCQIVEQKHRGSGTFQIIVNSNNSFYDREAANISFTAGNYSVSKLRVTHKGNIFLLDRTYCASTKVANSVVVSVQTIENTEWDTECDSWITVTKGEITSIDGISTTELNISWNDNNETSRYGMVSLLKAGATKADASFNIWQFGTEVTYDNEGNLLLESKNAETIELRAPRMTIKDIIAPTWVSYDVVENNDETLSYMLKFADNPSDAQHIRTTELQLSMLSGNANVPFPIVKQEYYFMEGLLTGPGLALFAKTWNEGGDVTPWFIDGVPTLIADIDMSEITDWAPIGTAERPWTGTFNGNGKKIINLTSSSPLFGFCKDAEITDLVFDESSSIKIEKKFGSELCLALLAGDVVNTTIDNCTNNADVLLNVSSTEASNVIYLAGLVGKADGASKIVNCTNNGTLTISAAYINAAGNRNISYIGGIVAHSTGIVDDSFNSGLIRHQGTVYSSYIGGIAGFVSDGSAKLRNNLNAGSIEFAVPRSGDAGRYGRIGGITSCAAGEIAGNTNDGDIALMSDIKSIHTGGIVGEYNVAGAKFVNNSNANASDISLSTKARYVYMGGLIGYINGVEFTCDLTEDTGFIGGTISTTGAGDGNAGSSTCLGGAIGYSTGKLNIKGASWNGVVKLDVKAATAMKNIALGGLIGCAQGETYISGADMHGSLLCEGNGLAINSYTHFGGVVGRVINGVTLEECSTNGHIEWPSGSGKSNNNPSSVGGMVGTIDGGNSSVTNCHGKGKVIGMQYVNNNYTTDYLFCSIGGIVGSYGKTAKFDTANSLQVKDCTVISPVESSRGCTGGIIGYAQYADVDKCTFTGRMSDLYNANAGGIIGIGDNVTITNSTVNTDIAGQHTGAFYFHGGGIAGIIFNESLIENCSYFGTIKRKVTDLDPEYFGGIVAYADNAKTIIRNCRYGGNINNVTITDSNTMDYVSDVATSGDHERVASVENITYWNGK